MQSKKTSPALSGESNSNPRQAPSHADASASINATPSVVQIVPALPPRIDGVGDFAVSLAVEMQSAFSISTAFASHHGGNSHPSSLDIQLQDQTALDAHLAEQLPHFLGPVILHYVGYGYDPSGSPDWLVHSIRRVKARGHRIVTIFHELYATGWPWQRAFWSSQAQKHVFQALVQASDVCVTSNPVYLRHIKQVNCEVPVVMLPIPSNMGELNVAASLNDRKRRMVIAGRKPSKKKVLDYPNETVEACSRLQLAEIVEVGEPSEHSASLREAASKRGIRYRCTGWLPSNDISGILAESYCGICAYRSDLWQKSGVIASYHAHGLLTILIPEKRDRKGILEQNLAVSVHDLSKSPCQLPPSLNLIARGGFESYVKSRSTKRYASVLLTVISPHQLSQEKAPVTGTGIVKPW